MMNKSIITNIIAIAILCLGYITQNKLLFNAGLFAFSGAVTNWLAVHMLFEKVPGLYGSGIIPARFESFKGAIKQLMMAQFFTQDNIEKFLTHSETHALDLHPIVEKVDFNHSFDELVEVIMHSSFGGMLSMFGGAESLQPLRAPFIEKMHSSLFTLSQSPEVQSAVTAQLHHSVSNENIQDKIEKIIDQRLDELTPELVKVMVQDIIKQHLGWLVVWGGVFGGIIGVISSYITV